MYMYMVQSQTRVRGINQITAQPLMREARREFQSKLVNAKQVRPPPHTLMHVDHLFLLGSRIFYTMIEGPF